MSTCFSSKALPEWKEIKYHNGFDHIPSYQQYNILGKAIDTGKVLTQSGFDK